MNTIVENKIWEELQKIDPEVKIDFEKQIVLRINEAWKNEQFTECDLIMKTINENIKKRETTAYDILCRAIIWLSHKIFIYLFDKLLYALDDNALRSVLLCAMNRTNDDLAKFNYLINHPSMEKFVKMKNFSHGKNLLSTTHNLHKNKFLCVLHSKFMDKNIFDSTKIKGIPILKYMFLEANGVEMYYDNLSLLEREKYFPCTLRSRKNSYDDAIISVINLGFVSRDSFVKPNGKLHDWLYAPSIEVYNALVEKGFLFGDELSIYQKCNNGEIFRTEKNNVENPTNDKVNEISIDDEVMEISDDEKLVSSHRKHFYKVLNKVVEIVKEIEKLCVIQAKIKAIRKSS